jgi:uncharacterized protein DUF5329
MLKLAPVALVALLLLSPGVARSEPRQVSLQAIEYLIDYVARSDSTFIRNGKIYTAKEAAAHLKSKYDYFKRDIQTPEDFIRLAGSKSELSGKPYEVKTSSGQVLTSAEWLGRLLTNYRAAH